MSKPSSFRGTAFVKKLRVLLDRVLKLREYARFCKTLRPPSLVEVKISPQRGEKSAIMHSLVRRSHAQRRRPDFTFPLQRCHRDYRRTGASRGRDLSGCRL